MPRIVDGRVTLDVTLIHPPEGIAEPEGQDVFLKWWSSEARRRSAPRPRWAGEDRKIAVNLLKRHGYERLRVLATHFWRRHASSIVNSEYDRHMVLFTAKIPIIEQELSTQV